MSTGIPPTGDEEQPITISPWVEGFFDEDRAVAALLLNETLFVSPSRLDHGYLCVLLNDVFAWGFGDAEELPYGEIKAVYEAVQADKEWGRIRWACARRNERPQFAVERDMRAAGAWDEAMEALPANKFDAHMRTIAPALVHQVGDEE